MTPEVDAQIAATWHSEWARANSGRPGASKRRQQIRKRWAYYLDLAAIVEANPHARCGNCKSFEQMPHDQRHHCSRQSDFYGYAIAEADDKPCVSWKQADQTQEQGT